MPFEKGMASLAAAAEKAAGTGTKRQGTSGEPTRWVGRVPQKPHKHRINTSGL
jgi:hypothetical protein